MNYRRLIIAALFGIVIYISLNSQSSSTTEEGFECPEKNTCSLDLYPDIFKEQIVKTFIGEKKEVCIPCAEWNINHPELKIKRTSNGVCGNL